MSPIRPSPVVPSLLAALAALALACSAPRDPSPTSTPPPPPPIVAPKLAPPSPERLVVLPEVPVEPPKPVTTPAYDLAHDLLARDADARARLGKGIETATVGGVFVLVGARGFTGGSFAQSRDLVTRALAAFTNGRFGKTPREAITVYLFGDAGSYGAFCKAAIHEPCISPYGFYWPSERWMVMNAGLGLGTLTHELVHPLVEADFPRAPTWLNEGIASVFEAPAFTKPGEIHGVKNWRLPRLKQALSSRERPKAMPHTLFGMSDTTFRDDDESLHYALARYVCQWLDERGKLWEFYHAFRDDRDADPTGEKAFTRVVGMTPTAADTAFLGWLSRL